MMDLILKKTLLFDFYGVLLTERQREMYELYNLDDLSLGEMSEQLSISRQGVHDAVKRCDKLLNHYEDKLQLVYRFTKNKERAKRICQIVADMKKQSNQAELDEIELLTKAMIEDM